MKVLVIEFFPPEMQERIQRKEFWLRAQATYSQRGIEIMIPEQCLHNRTHERRFSFEGVDLVFVHESDNYGFSDQAAIERKPVVCYGGRTTQGDYSRVQELMIDFLPISVLMPNLNPFFDRLIVGGNVTVDAFYVLIGHDPHLEAVLELLHTCLTPDGAKVARGVQNYHLIKNQVESIKVSVTKDDGNGNQVTEEVPVIDYLKDLSADEVFEDEYIKPLEKLRDELLKNYQ
jgi:hypothetical protein